MMKINRFLAPIDFSEYSEKAFDYALKLAERVPAQITLINIDEMFQSIYPEDSLQLYNNEDAIRERIEKIQEQIRTYVQKGQEKNIDTHYAIVRGDSVSEKLLEHINGEQYDLVVMGTHGRTGIKHLFLGSIAEKIVRLSPIPVLTVHKCVEDCHLENILVPIDFSQYSRDALEYALEIAKKVGASITVIHVIERVIYPAFYPEGYYPILDFEPTLHKQVLENIDTFFKQIPGLTAEKVVSAGRPSDEIKNYAENNNMDLIIMATRGLSGLQHLIVGSTAERVVRSSSIPVLTVRHREEHNLNP
jgi:nucleotide-binding universal stress UspA family protein